MYQKIIIIGNLGGDPEMRYTPSGQAVCNYSVAVNRTWTSNDGSKGEETAWFRVSSWGKRAEIDNQYLRKGQRVLVEGRLSPDKETGGPRIWTKQDGTSAASYEITAETVKFLSPRSEDQGGYSAESSQSVSESEDIPF
jgi:single-strand DNA-binding protein